MRRRRSILSAAAVAVLLLVATAAGWPVYVHPRTDSVSAADPADAVVALGGSTGTAIYAETLVKEGRAKQAVLSNPYGPWVPEMVDLCPVTPRLGTTCFVPHPSTTRGEAQEIGRMARANGWDDVIVVAPTFHISRARFITKRCYSGRLRMIDPHISFSWYDWVYQYSYQTTGFIKASFQRGC